MFKGTDRRHGTQHTGPTSHSRPRSFWYRDGRLNGARWLSWWPLLFMGLGAALVETGRDTPPSEHRGVIIAHAGRTGRDGHGARWRPRSGAPRPGWA